VLRWKWLVENWLFNHINLTYILTCLRKRSHKGMDIVYDRQGNEIYITDERWEHVYKRHPEVAGYEAHVLKTLRSGIRKQQPLEPDIFKYSRFYDDLPENHTQIIVVVKFGQKIDEVVHEVTTVRRSRPLLFAERSEQGQVESNNFVITAYMK